MNNSHQQSRGKLTNKNLHFRNLLSGILTGHHINGFGGTCGQKCPHTTALARLEKCLIDNMMPLYGSEKCYPLFEQGPCDDGKWFVLNSEINGTLLPYAHCEKALDCEVFALKSDYAGKNTLSAKFQLVFYIPDHNLHKGWIDIQ